MKQNKNIEELFKDGFDSFEPNVPSSAWNAINNNFSNLGATSVASAKGLSFGITMAVASLVSLVGANVIIENNKIEEVQPKNQVNSIVNEFENTADYEETVEIIAVQDETVRTNIVQIKKASVVSKEQEAAAKTVLAKTLDNLVVHTEVTKNNSADLKDDLTAIERSNNALIEASKIESNNINSNEASLNEIKEENSITNVGSNHEPSTNTTSRLISIPNVFTPNGDYRNDEFFIKSVGMADFYVRIIDEKGNTIFESTDASFRWNGEDQFNNNVLEGNYYCVIKALGMDGVSYSKTSLLYVKR